MDLWPDSFEADLITTPKELIENAIKELPSRTQGSVFAEVVEKQVLEEKPEGEKLIPKSIFEMMIPSPRKFDFNYELRIRGHYLSNYMFRILTFRHDIPVYPVSITLEDTISKELQLPNRTFSVSSEEELIDILGGAFKSNHLRKIIGTLMKMSPETPF